MNLFAIPVRRPVATAMFFLAAVLLGIIGLVKIPVELIPSLSGDSLYVNFSRPGSEPEVVEREILLPLSGKIARLEGVAETWGEVRGSGGNMEIEFEPGTDLKVRELELRRMATELAREQPIGTVVNVSSFDFSQISRFVMMVQVSGMNDRFALYDFVDDRVRQRLSGVSGVGQVMVMGGAPLEVTVRIDPDRCAALGIDPQQVAGTLARSVQRLSYLGGTEESTGRTAVVLDGRPAGVVSLGETRIAQGSPVRLRHVAEIDYGAGELRSEYRVNGRPSVAMVVFKDEGANLVTLGRELRDRMEFLEKEFSHYGLRFDITFDGAQTVEDQIHRLRKLALSGFLIALVVLFLFLRQGRAVGVVAVAVPVSLLAAMAMLYLGGQSLNLITLFGLAVAVGMLVDNSIVVYEAVQRRLERGYSPDAAAEEGVRRTFRAILAASTTTAAVFLPLAFVSFDDTMIRTTMTILALAILLPLGASLVVAVGLVPLLARRMAAPAALARITAQRERRESLAGMVEPDRAREIFGGVLKAALRRPAGMLSLVALGVVLTVIIALPWVAITTASQEAPEATEIQLAVDLPAAGSLEGAVETFESLEQSVLDLEGVERVESVIQEDQGSLTVYLLPKTERPDDLNAARIRSVLRETARRHNDVTVRSQDAGGGGGGGGGARGGGGGGLPGQGPAEVVLSGPDFRQLNLLAREIESQLGTIPEIETVHSTSRPGRDELRVVPRADSLAAFGLSADEILPVLRMVRREGIDMQIGFTMEDGREVPLTVRRPEKDRRAMEDLRRLRMPTRAGVLPLESVASVHRMPPPPTIRHHNGRREAVVYYRLGYQAPETGPARTALEERIQDAVQQVHRPVGYTVETAAVDEGFAWFRDVLVPILLLLLAILAITFESLTLPILILLALPLTLLGGVWGLVLSGTPAGPFALAGAVALIGLTVNPAILLVDRMQQHMRSGVMTAGAAALAAVRERTRPVLMTAATTIAGLWPLALTTGEQFELWPPFAIVVMGGLATSTVLTLLVVPVGFVILRRLDDLFGRLGPWVMIGWGLATAAVITPLVRAGLITAMTWQILTTVLVAGLLLGLAALVIWRPVLPEPDRSAGPPPVEVRFLGKIYGRAGPIGRAWRVTERFAARVLARGGTAFDPADARTAMISLVLLLAGVGYLSWAVQTLFWEVVFLYVAAALASRLLLEVRRARGRADALGRVDPGGVEGILSFFCPWIVTLYIVLREYALPKLEGESAGIALAVLIPMVLIVFLSQQGRRTAVRLSRGDLPRRVPAGRLQRFWILWRWLSKRVFGLDLPREEVHALAGAAFRVDGGMVGILGPNGAGKTTLLRILAGILDPSVGAVTLGGIRLEAVRRYLARWVGYLPQEFGLPADMTAREYLEYYALLYEIPEKERRERVERLLKEVGLGERAGDKIGNYSGGMRQRVAVARTLLRLPPVIIVDEPTVGLDPRERIRFRNLLSRLAEGRIVLFSTHVVEDVAVACERVIVLARGRLVFDGVPDDLAAHAQGKVWEVHLAAGEEKTIPGDARIVDQVPEPDGRARTRILHAGSPHENARPVEATLEDGYLVLAGGGGPIS